MAPGRTYRHDVRCPDCGSNPPQADARTGFPTGSRLTVAGIVGGRYVPAGAYRRPGSAVKERGIELCLEGNTLSGIGRVLGYGVSAVQGWVKKRDGKR